MLGCRQVLSYLYIVNGIFIQGLRSFWRVGFVLKSLVVFRFFDFLSSMNSKEFVFGDEECQFFLAKVEVIEGFEGVEEGEILNEGKFQKIF